MNALPRLVASTADKPFETWEDRFWHAVLTRDEHCDGRFVFAVRSTGIYCRPSCPARRPQRDRVAFFLTSAGAERAGFRPCRRCTPRLFDDALGKRRLDAELKVAAALQARLQPSPLSDRPDWDVSAASVPCREIGGDYVDYFRRARDGRLIIALGDVVGKGVGAALLMSSLHAAVHAQADTGAPPRVVLTELNRYLHDSTPREAFATLFYAEIDLDAGTLTAANAGHNPPLVWFLHSDVIRLVVGGVPLGMLPTASYEEQSLMLPHGALVLAYSDGITDWENPEGAEFGEARLLDELRRPGVRTAPCTRHDVQEAVWRFARGSAQTDDASLLVVRRV